MREIISREQALIEQRKAFERMNYDGHNRRSGITTMHGLGIRRSRRKWHMIMRAMTLDINSKAAYPY